LLLTLLVVGLFGRQVADELAGAERRVGVLLEETERGVEASAVSDESPAGRAGLEIGDRVVAIDGGEIASLEDYDLAAEDLERGVGIEFQIERDGRTFGVELRPGTPPEWGRIALRALLIAGLLGLALLAYTQRAEEDVRARLLFIFSALLAIESALPYEGLDEVWLDAATSLFYLVTGAQLAVELHLVSLIPERRPWLARRPWIVPCYYALGGTIAMLLLIPFLAEVLPGVSPLPWSPLETDDLFNRFVLPLWALTVALILGRSALIHAQPQGRHRAALVLLGVLPWALYAWISAGYVWAGDSPPAWLELNVSWFLLPYPVAVFFAIFRYQLFDLELVVRRGLVYTLLTGALLLMSYAGLGAGTVLVSDWLGEGEKHELWVVAVTALILGLLFGPLRRAIHDWIERRFFPERLLLRGRLGELASELPAQGKVPRMAQHLAEELCDIFQLRWVSLLLAEPRSGMLRTAATCQGGAGGTQQPPISLLLDPKDPAIELLTAEAKPLGAHKLATVSPQLSLRLGPLEVMLVAPLVVRDRLVGLLILGRRRRRGPEHRLPAEEVDLLGLLAQHVAVVFENVRLFQSATYENLTGLLRREAVSEVLEKEVARALRHDRPLTVGLADLDHFKKINDRHGHLAGDEVLRRVAEELSGSLRGTDSVGRYGGEEFLLVFPETEIGGAVTVAEKIRSRIENLGIDTEDGFRISVAISIGVASLDELPVETSSPAHSLIDAADRALYRAKESGRNRVEPRLQTVETAG